MNFADSDMPRTILNPRLVDKALLTDFVHLPASCHSNSSGDWGVLPAGDPLLNRLAEVQKRNGDPVSNVKKQIRQTQSFAERVNQALFALQQLWRRRPG